ncbi:hypothetical protein RI845_09300 [Thalassotalea nanhaiensis]|uniref:Lipoprotein n=1 Tax=Thalassotalea nanhaiensis TaxID=3065648 RepID=A0ABY9TNB2_9GAMM|nr:hypothetical protein RI845_09300 [Colwelliaceae bacterium SQ345]
MSTKIKTYLICALTMIMVGCSTSPTSNSFDQDNVRAIKLSGKNYSGIEKYSEAQWHFEIESIRHLDSNKYIFNAKGNQETFEQNILKVKPKKYIVVVDCFYKTNNSNEENFRKREEHTINLRWIEGVSFHVGSVEDACSMRPLYNSIMI